MVFLSLLSKLTALQISQLSAKKLTALLSMLSPPKNHPEWRRFIYLVNEDSKKGISVIEMGSLLKRKRGDKSKQRQRNVKSGLTKTCLFLKWVF